MQAPLRRQKLACPQKDEGAMKLAIRLVLGMALAFAADVPLHAQTGTTSPIVIEQPWARATPGGAKIGAAYMTLINNGDSADQLIGATTPAADEVQFHGTT